MAKIAAKYIGILHIYINLFLFVLLQFDVPQLIFAVQLIVGVYLWPVSTK